MSLIPYGTPIIIASARDLYDEIILQVSGNLQTYNQGNVTVNYYECAMVQTINNRCTSSGFNFIINPVTNIPICGSNGSGNNYASFNDSVTISYFDNATNQWMYMANGYQESNIMFTKLDPTVTNYINFTWILSSSHSNIPGCGTLNSASSVYLVNVDPQSKDVQRAYMWGNNLKVGSGITPYDTFNIIPCNTSQTFTIPKPHGGLNYRSPKILCNTNRSQTHKSNKEYYNILRTKSNNWLIIFLLIVILIMVLYIFTRKPFKCGNNV
jgi:hypothetical protein